MAIFVPRFVRQLRDVLLTAPADGEVLTYDSADEKWKNEAGGGGGGPPTGAAGGVLGGTYPNPGFAADMATQAELDALVGALIQTGSASPLAPAVDPTGNNTTPAGKGALYVNTTDGALYLAVGLTSSDWVIVSGLQAFGGAPGIQNNGGSLYLMGGGTGVAITDVASDVSLDFFNGLEWLFNGLHGAQTLKLTLGDAGQHVWTFLADGTIDFPTGKGIDGGDVVSGTVAEPRIDAAIARDSEVTAAVAAEASARTTADGLLVAKSLYDANTVLVAHADDTPVAITMAASTMLARLASGDTKAASVAETRALLQVPAPTSGIVSPFPNPMQFPISSNYAPTANVMVACRCIVPVTGTIREIAIYIQTQNGNIDVGIYDDAATTRNRLYGSGSVACPAAGAWRAVGDANLAVVAGQNIDLAVAGDGSFQILRVLGFNLAQAQLPTGFWATANGATPLLAWNKTVSFPLPATVLESAMTATQGVPGIIARIVPS